MTGITTIAASGLAAAETRLMASASNIANMQSAGPGGATAQPTAASPGYSLAYDPGAPNVQRMVAMPNVDLPREMVNQMDAVNAYKANIAVFKTADKTVKALLDTIA